MLRTTFSLVLSASALVLTGCGRDDAAAPVSNMSPGAATDARTDAASPQTGAPSLLWNGGARKALDIQSAHPNGVVLQITSLQSRPTETVVGIRVMNGREQEIDLNRFNRRNGYIVLDSGERLYLSPPANNSRVSVPAGQTLEGEFVFLGRLPPVPNAVLILNENAATDNEYTTTPGFRIDLPLSGAAS